MKKVFALVDCNSFFCSCERIFRPDLRNKPVVVLSNNDGCVIARTNEAKALGIKMTEPYFKIKKYCKSHGLIVFSSNFSLYTDISDRVMSTLDKLCPRIQVYSVDEAFCDLSGIKDLDSFGRVIKETIMTNIGIPVGVGIAPTKVLSKIANHIAKKSLKANGIVNLMDEKLQDVALKMTPVEDIWGIGRASSEKLKRWGVHTAYDYKIFKDEKLLQGLLSKTGVQIKHELMGESIFPFDLDIEAKKEIMCSRTFAKSVSDLNALKEAVASYICNASEKMRGQNSLCMEISIFVRTNPHNGSDQYYLYDREVLQNPTADSRKLIRIAHSLLEKNYREDYEYKKAGVKISNFYHSQEYQMNFLYPADSNKDMCLMRVIDEINYREGAESIKLGACGLNKKAWSMNRNYKSPRYTTSWEELFSWGKR